jgi:hypothetical protein
MSVRQGMLQTRLQEGQTRWNQLNQKLTALRQQRDYETRIEEKLRMDTLIEETESECDRLEAELSQIEAELNTLSASTQATPPVATPLPSGPPSPAHPPASGPLTLFYSYSHQDEALRERLEVHLKLLKRQGILNDWHDRNISAGTEWAGQISSHLEAADIILLLVSADFLASDYCWDIEMKRALERHEARQARVIPVVLRPADWHTAPFGKLQGLPKDARPVTQWADQDEAFTDIARGIRQVAAELGRRV